jgi:hypothetical protein
MKSFKNMPGRKSWTLRDWHRKDSDGLAALMRDKPEEYCKLFKAQYGREISVEQVKAMRI